MHLINEPTLNLLGKVIEKPLPSTLLMLIMKAHSAKMVEAASAKDMLTTSNFRVGNTWGRSSLY